MQSMNVSGIRSGTRTAISLAALLSCALAGSGWAMEIDTGNPDNQLRFDTSVRYNLGVRTQGQDAAITANPNYNDGDLAFAKGHLTTNRLDLLSELDFVAHKEYGFRVSAAAWADAAYHNLPNNNPTPNTLVNGVPIRVDGAPEAEGLAARPGVVLRG